MHYKHSYIYIDIYYQHPYHQRYRTLNHFVVQLQKINIAICTNAQVNKFNTFVAQLGTQI